jgi:hypothetical protein
MSYIAHAAYIVSRPWHRGQQPRSDFVLHLGDNSKYGAMHGMRPAKLVRIMKVDDRAEKIIVKPLDFCNVLYPRGQ